MMSGYPDIISIICCTSLCCFIFWNDSYQWSSLWSLVY